MNDPKESVSDPIRNGHKAVGTAPVQVSASPTKFVKGVVVLADSSNSAPVYVGGYNVTADTAETSGGFPLEAGKSVSLQIEDLSRLWAISTADAQGVAWIAI
ncbi:MAG: hypothetical protein ACTHK7_16005 [Aureliella sp.]